MVAAAEGNHPKVVWWLHNNVQVQRWLFENVVTAAVKNEDMMMVEWVHQTYAFGPRDVPDAMKEAVNTGRIDIMNWMYEHGYSDQLVGVDNLEVFEWLLERNMVKVGRSVAWFLSQGRLELAKHLYDHYRHKRMRPHPFFSHTLRPDAPSDDSTWITPRTMLYTLTEGHRDCVQWLFETFADAEDIDLFKSITRQEWEDPNEVHVMDTAAKHGHLGVIKYLHAISVLFKENDKKKRKRGGTMSGTGPTCSSAAIDLAAGNNHLQVVEWLHHNRKEGFTEQAVHLAAINGHVEMVQWLQKHRAHEFIAATMDLAAQNGHLQVVKWLHDQNASCTTNAMDGAAGEGHLEVVKWLHEHRAEGCTTAAMDSAARGGHLDVVKWLHSNRSEGCTTAAMDAAAEKSFSDVVQWLHFNRKEGCTTAAMDAAATENNFDLVLFLQCYRREGPTRAAFVNTDDALTENIYEWLAEHYPDLEPPQN